MNFSASVSDTMPAPAPTSCVHNSKGVGRLCGGVVIVDAFVKSRWVDRAILDVLVPVKILALEAENPLVLPSVG